MYFSRFRVSFQRSSRTLYFGCTFPPLSYFSGTFPASEYLFSAHGGLFILAPLFPLPGIFSALLEDSLFWMYFFRFRVSFQRSWRTLYFGCTFFASEYLFSAPRGLFILVVLFSLPSIFLALLEDSLFWMYFFRFRVSVQRSSRTICATSEYNSGTCCSALLEDYLRN